MVNGKSIIFESTYLRNTCIWNKSSTIHKIQTLKKKQICQMKNNKLKRTKWDCGEPV